MVTLANSFSERCAFLQASRRGSRIDSKSVYDEGRPRSRAACKLSSRSCTSSVAQGAPAPTLFRRSLLRANREAVEGAARPRKGVGVDERVRTHPDVQARQ